jgi:hypothetical protein
MSSDDPVEGNEGADSRKKCCAVSLVDMRGTSARPGSAAGEQLPGRHAENRKTCTERTEFT